MQATNRYVDEHKRTLHTRTHTQTKHNCVYVCVCGIRACMQMQLCSRESESVDQYSAQNVS